MRPRVRTTVLAAAFLAMLLASGPRAGQAAPEIAVPVCATAPKLDAQLEDAAWKEATKLTGFRTLGTSEPAAVQTTAWVCRDNTWLYVAFRCFEPEKLSIRRVVTRRDDAVTRDDAVQVFLDPGTGGKEWIDLQLSAGNVQADQLCRGSERVRDWDLPWRSAAQPDAHTDTSQGWAAEIAIPLALLQERAGPEPWRMNLCRVRRTSSPVENTTLAALPGTTFQAPQHFLEVQGLTGFQAAAPFAPMLGPIKVRPLRVAGKSAFYELVVTVKNATATPGTVEVVAQDLPRGGNGQQGVQAVQLGASQEKAATVRLSVASPGARSASVGLREPGSALWLQKTEVAGMEALLPFDAYLDRSYYTTEKEARIWVDVALEPAARTGLTLEARALGADGKVIASGSVPCAGREASIPLPLAKLPVGASAVKVSLVNAAKVSAGRVDLSLLKRAPPPRGTNEVKIDRYNRCLIVNGKPFFPLGAFGLHHWGHLEGERLAYYDAQYRYCREAGLNFICDWRGYRPTPEGLQDCRIDYDLAHKYGLKVVGLPWSITPDLYYSSPKFREAATGLIKGLDPYLEMCSKHPAVIGYYHFDEPTPNLTIDDLLEAYRAKCHSIAPYHFVYMSLTRTIHNPRWFGTVTDLLGAHNYWYVERPETLAKNGAYYDAVDQHARKAHSPTMHAPHLDSWGVGYQGGGFMTPEEQRASTYLALIHGARSVMYFAMPFRHQLSVQTQKQVSAEVHALAPALVTREPLQSVTFEPESAANPGLTPDRKFPLVDVALKNHPQGGQVLLALNVAREPVSVRFRVSSLTPQSTVQAMFGDRRQYAVKNGAFTDTLEGLGTRAYRLTATRTPKEAPVALHVAMSGPGVAEPAVQVAVASSGTARFDPPGKNRVLNSSFEDARVPDFPRHWMAQGGIYLPPDRRASGLEAENPFHGKYSFRIAPFTEAMAYPSSPFRVEKGKTYTLSAYLRADRPDTEVRLGIGGPDVTFVKVDTTWKRYTLTFQVKDVEEGWSRKSFNIIPWGGAAWNVYVDAVQVEEGAEPTEYEPT
ncbi:MAG: hypothetical protein HY321_01200 [Armatimonadetes bacterium]|nr:hypothetical protein [Armatimonadota bacterium]